MASSFKKLKILKKYKLFSVLQNFISVFSMPKEQMTFWTDGFKKWPD